MHQVFNLSLAQLHAATETAQARSEVFIEQQPSGIVIPGSVLEAAVEVSPGRYVLFVTDGIAYEESLTIVLCQRDEGVQEIIYIEHAYTSGFFEALNIYNDHIQFQFFKDTLWSLRVADSPKFTLPFIGDPKGVKRNAGFTKRLIITLND
ncbi:hypothetical protein HA51_20645 [Pantoea rwandensis]|uniref:Uncharacterized protein n=2 Tax=Pantoea rwandensis TaxID=1076550 RepID=A0A1X1CS48_9GAMM|nr:hypothetical protein HA51_20645 [Pantoea rwandensis]